MKAKNLGRGWRKTSRNKQKIKEKQVKAAANEDMIELVE